MHGKSKMPFNIGLWQGVDGSRIMAALNGKTMFTNGMVEISAKITT